MAGQRGVQPWDALFRIDVSLQQTRVSWPCLQTSEHGVAGTGSVCASIPLTAAMGAATAQVGGREAFATRASVVAYCGSASSLMMW